MQGQIDSSLIALVSVVFTGLVSLLSVFVPSLMEWCKGRNQHRENELDRIDTAAERLLRDLVPFRHTEYEDIQPSAERNVVKLHSDLQLSHYAWERAVWAHIDDRNKDRVRRLRGIFEATRDPSEYTGQMQELAEEILSLTQLATSRA